LAFGPILGRHELGEPECLDKVERADLSRHWESYFHAGRMTVAVAGPLEAEHVARVFQDHFADFGDPQQAGRSARPLEFEPVIEHYAKQLEQEQIAVCWPGVAAQDDDFPVQQVVLGILSGGMSGRLFTEVREKQGLVYWVGASHETPRGCSVIFLGASTTPDRCDQTFRVLLREVDRLAEDIQQEEVDRAVTGLVAQQETRGDSTRSRCSELASDLFHYARPIPVEEKLAKLQAVSLEDIRRYLVEHPRNRRCVVTLGPRALSRAVTCS
jgi:predicted Zn-dependent peptidase